MEGIRILHRRDGSGLGLKRVCAIGVKTICACSQARLVILFPLDLEAVPLGLNTTFRDPSFEPRLDARCFSLKLMFECLGPAHTRCPTITPTLNLGRGYLQLFQWIACNILDPKPSNRLHVFFSIPSALFRDVYSLSQPRLT